MNRSGDAACRRSCLQQPETLVRGLGPHRQDRLRILHPITYVIAILCYHGAARDWRQADTMQAEGGRGRTADGAPAAAAPGETLEGAVSAAVAEDGRRLSETVEDGRGRSRVVEDGRRHGGRGERSDKARRGPREIYCCGGVAARGVLAVSSLASRFESGRQHQVRRSQCVRYEGSLSAIGRLRQSVPRVVSAGRRCTRPRRALRLCSGREVWRCGSAAGIPDASALALPRCPMRVPWCMERTHYSAHGAGEEDMTWHGLRPRRRRRRR